jgi:hypothetical protein
VVEHEAADGSTRAIVGMMRRTGYMRFYHRLKRLRPRSPRTRLATKYGIKFRVVDLRQAWPNWSRT